MSAAAEPAMDAAAFLAAIVASSDDAIVGKTLDGTIVSWNAAAERIFGWSAPEMVGQSIRRIIPAERQGEEDAIVASIGRGERVPTFETVRLRKGGGTVTLAITVSPVRDGSGAIVGASKIARDIGREKRIIAQLEDSELRFRLLADNMAQLAWIADSKGWIFWYNQRWFDFTGTTLKQMEGWGWSVVQHPDHLPRVTARWRDHLDGGNGAWEDTFPLRGADGEYRWFLSRAIPISDPDGRVAYWLGTNTDVTEMRDAEQRIELLMMEVNHRSKNMLAVIQSLARRTAAQGGDFVPRFEARIQALAATQDLLVGRSWESVPVAETIEAQLAPLGDFGRQVTREGPAVALAPAAAEAIAMAFHEMATNAVKYGALSVASGRVTIRWSIVRAQDEGEPRFTISWRESGGPPVAAPTSKGFGTRIIADVPRGKLNAEVALEFAPEGFTWSLTCPAANIGWSRPVFRRPDGG